jgi:hypothetical protein
MPASWKVLLLLSVFIEEEGRLLHYSSHKLLRRAETVFWFKCSSRSRQLCFLGSTSSTRAMQKQGKRLIGAAVIICGTALILGIVLGTRHSNKSKNLKGSAILGSDAVLAKCGALQMYNSGTSNTLDGTFTDFAYGPNLESCCAAEYACPWAAVATYSCPNGSMVYEATCCTAKPVGSDYSSCQSSNMYQAAAGAGASRRLAIASGCVPTTAMEVCEVQTYI